MSNQSTPRFIPNFNLGPSNGNSRYIQMKMSCSDRDKKGNRARATYSIGYSIPENLWGDGAPKRSSKVDERINVRIKQIEKWITEFTEANKTVISSDLITFLKGKDGRTREQEVKVKDSFYEAIKAKIKDVENGDITNNGQDFAALTIKNWKSSLEQLKKFDANLSFDSNTEDVRDSFLAWSNKQGFSKSYADRVIKDWKRFFKLAGKSLDFKRISGKDLKSRRTDIWLNEAEIAAIAELKLEGSDDEIRDRFIMNCCCGLRVSDMNALTKANMVDDILTVEYTQKTGGKFEMDMREEKLYMAIWEKYGCDFPPKYHEVTVNERIKDIAAKAKISQLIELKESEIPMRLRAKLKDSEKVYETDAKKRTVKIPKCELLTNHTARRSKITNELAKGTRLNELSTTMALSEVTMSKSYSKEDGRAIIERRRKAKAA